MQRPGSISAAILCKSGVALIDTESHCACDCCNERSLATISAMRLALAPATRSLSNKA